MTTKWKGSKAQERLAVAATDFLVNKLGHIFREQEHNDVGIDAHVELVDEKTQGATGQLVALQIKGGPSFFKEIADDAWIFRGKPKHLDYWLNHSLPVFLVLVDTTKQRAYWQEISPVTIEPLKKGWKVKVPFTQLLEINFVPVVRERVGLDAGAASYTRLSLKDTSIPSARRYSATILMRSPVTRLRAEAVVRRSLSDIRKERYQKTDYFRELFGDRDTDVVSLYVAGDLNDVESANWYCRAMWASKNVPAAARPGTINGVNFGDGLEIVWCAEYSKDSQFYNSLQIDKQEFLTEVNKFIVNAETLIGESFADGTQIICSSKLMPQHAASMRELYAESNKTGLPPYECNDATHRFQDVMALADNAFIYALKFIEEPQNGAWTVLLEIALRDYRKNLDRLRYELEKVR